MIIVKKIIIFSSARSFGNTRRVVEDILDKNNDIPIIDLNTVNIQPYDYDYRNQADDFIDLIKEIINYEIIIFATPVYWYTMSGPMKIFLDRFSDLLDIQKELGRQLRGKKLFVIASFNTDYPRGFEDTFEQTCNYLGIIYLGTSFICSNQTDPKFSQNNILYIQKAREILNL